MFNIHLLPYYSMNLVHFHLEQRKRCQKRMILQRGNFFLCSIKLNGAERVKISISQILRRPALYRLLTQSGMMRLVQKYFPAKHPSLFSSQIFRSSFQTFETCRASLASWSLPALVAFTANLKQRVLKETKQWNRAGISKASYNFIQTSIKLCPNFYRTLCKLLSNFVQTSIKLCANSYRTLCKLLSNFVQTPIELCANFLRTVYKLLSNIVQTSYELLSNFVQTSYELCTNFL